MSFCRLAVAIVLVCGFSLEGFSARRIVGRKVYRKTASGKFVEAKRSRVSTSMKGIRLRKKRRMAIGSTLGGGLGYLGVNMELNFTEKIGFVLGYGGGNGFNALEIQLKKYLGGDSFLPYVGAGYSRWSGSGSEDGLTNTNPKLLVEKFLSDEEKLSGKFGLNLVYPTVGLQYVNLDGSWAGFSLFTEVAMLVDIASLNVAPTAALGVMYYF